jgi:predicted DNA-binding antitoxin AbrB/MazE fold protein
MVIHAVYKNGVFRPIDPVELPENCQVEILIHQPASADSRTSAASSLTKLAAIARDLPNNPDLPTDLAEQHDHYLYRAAKKS